MLCIKEEVVMNSVVKLKSSKLQAAKSLMVAARLQEETDPEFAAALYRKAAMSMWRLLNSREQQVSFLRDEILELRNMKRDALNESNHEKSPFSGIFLDFEGEGKSPVSGKFPEPHMAGIYRRGLAPTSDGYQAFCFRANWEPLTKGVGNFVFMRSFEDFIEQLLSEAQSAGQKIFYWSDHEKKVIELYASKRLFEDFVAQSLNVLPAAKSYIKAQNLTLPKEHEKVLNKYLSILSPASDLVETPETGPAESCKRIDQYLLRKRRWRDLDAKQRKVVGDLFAYNKQDCLALMRIAKKLHSRSRLLRKTISSVA